MKKKNSLIKKIENLNLNACEIEEILDSASVTDEIVDYIAAAYKNSLPTDEFYRVNDIIELLDLTKRDEKIISSTLLEAAKRSFCSLVMAGKLSRLEIVYFVKNNLVSDNEAVNILSQIKTQDFADVLLRWRPQIFMRCRSLWDKYSITLAKIEESKHRAIALEKFKFLTE